MKHNIIKMAALMAAAVLAASCGGNGGSKNSYPDSEFFGKVLALQCQYTDQDSVLKAEIEEAEKNTEWSESGVKKFTELKEKNKAQREQNKADLKTALDKELPNITGKDIPFAMEGDCGYEVTEVKITGLNDMGEVKLTAKFRVTDKKVAKSFDTKSMDVSWYQADAQGADTKRDHGMARVKFDQPIEVGSENSVDIILCNYTNSKAAKEYYNFGKLMFE